MAPAGGMDIETDDPSVAQKILEEIMQYALQKQGSDLKGRYSPEADAALHAAGMSKDGEPDGDEAGASKIPGVVPDGDGDESTDGITPEDLERLLAQ
jgi:hypothetical protein